MSSPHLTDAEIAEITEPLTQAAARRKFFESRGMKVDRKPNGQPLVSRADWDTSLAANPDATRRPAEDAPAIDLDRVRAIGRKPKSQAVVA